MTWKISVNGQPEATHDQHGYLLQLPGSEASAHPWQEEDVDGVKSGRAQMDDRFSEASSAVSMHATVAWASDHLSVAVCYRCGLLTPKTRPLPIQLPFPAVMQVALPKELFQRPFGTLLQWNSCEIRNVFQTVVALATLKAGIPRT